MSMHNTLAVLFSTILFFFTTSTSSLYIPQPHRPQNPLVQSTSNICTFTLFHKQLCHHNTRVPINYIQFNTLVDHANSLTIDIAALRPAAAHNSYSKINEHQVFAIEGLLDDRNLTIRGSDGSAEVRFESAGLGWSSTRGNGVARCVVEEWDVKDWGCGVGSRVSSSVAWSVELC
jgi:hypothetical protein